MKTQNTRTKVIKTLINVQNGLSLSNMLDGLLADVSDADRGFVHNLLLTTLRHWYATARLLDTLADKPIDEIEVRTTLQVGMTQLLYLEVADHASIFETVESVKQLEFERASSLVNAILRKVAKNPNKYRKQCDKKHSLPNWLAKQLKQDWREQYNELCKGLRTSAPMCLRVNARQATVEEYSSQLTKAEIAHEVVDLSLSLQGVALQDLELQKMALQKVAKETADKMFHVKPIRLTESIAVNKLPNFATGMVSVQDVHASLAGAMVKVLADAMLESLPQSLSQHALPRGGESAPLLEKVKSLPRGGRLGGGTLHILDACTAPSGKLAHCLEQFASEQIVKVVETKVGMDSKGNDKFLLKHQADSTGNIQFTAIDNEAKRLQRSEQTLERLGLTDEVNLLCVDATDWQLGKTSPEQFDIILLDAPCTATGVIRRHPDISLLRQETDIEATATLQRNILDNMWSQLKTGGYLIYATCSILKAENEQQMQGFLASHDNAKEIKINGNWGIEQAVGRQCLPLISSERIGAEKVSSEKISSENESSGGDGFYYAVLRKG